MITALYGFKLGQTRQFTENGMQIPVTRIVVDPCVVTQILDTTTHKSYQLGVGSAKKLNKAKEGQIKKAGIETKPRFLREVRVETFDESLTLGKVVTPEEVFAVGDAVSVTGVSKGKGYAGVVKRHGFHGGPKTHGQSDRHRAPGAIGSGTTPGRVYRGKRMAGRMGSDTVTIQGLEVVGIDSEKHIVTVKGLIPGPKNGLVRIAKER